MSIKVSLIEDNQTLRHALADLIKSEPNFRLGDACATGEEALRNLPRNPPDVVLADINLPGISGTECVRQLKRCLPRTQFIMVTVEDDGESVFEALKAGASGYLVKNEPAEQIVAAIRDVHAGGSPMSSPIARMVVQAFHARRIGAPVEWDLTPREQEILQLLTKGYRSKEVAGELGIAVHTVNSHLRNIYEKLQVRSRAEAVARFLEK